MVNFRQIILKWGGAVKLLLVFSFLLYVGVGFLIFVYQKKFIYYPSQQVFAVCGAFKDSQKININGTRAYYKINSRNLVVFYHGNAGSACDRENIKNEFEKMGLSYIFVEYAGYSDDNLEPSKKLLMKDVENVADFIAKNDFSKVFVMGESLGTTLAAYHSSLAKIDKLLLVSPFYRMADLANNNLAIYPASFMLTENYDSGEWMSKTKAENVEIIHGNMDEVIPLSQSKKLFNEVGAPNKKFVEIEHAGHNDIYNFEKTQLAMEDLFSGNDKTAQ